MEQQRSCTKSWEYWQPKQPKKPSREDNKHKLIRLSNDLNNQVLDYIYDEDLIAKDVVVWNMRETANKITSIISSMDDEFLLGFELMGSKPTIKTADDFMVEFYRQNYIHKRLVGNILSIKIDPSFQDSNFFNSWSKYEDGSYDIWGNRVYIRTE